MTAGLSPQGTRRAYIHIGAPKTGSTYIQRLLWNNRDALDRAGVCLPGEGQWQHYHAGQDLRDVAFNPGDPGLDWTGVWDALAELSRESAQPAIVLSDERLAALSPDQVERAVAGLEPREVHVIYSIRDLPGLLPSEWQEYLKHGSVQPFDEWAEQVLVTGEGPANWFWRVHDVESVLNRWATAVPTERIHVITMPPPTAPRDEMWRRFAQVLGCEPSVVTDYDTAANVSLGLASAEVLRLVNGKLSSDLPRWHRAGVVRDILANQVLNPLGPRSRPQIPAHLIEVIDRRTSLTQHLLPTLGCDVVGDMSDLATPRPDAGAPDPDPQELTAVATAALAKLMDHMAAMRDELRDERIDRREAEERMAAEKAAEIIRVLSEQEAAFWSDHPVARRLQTAKESVVHAESGNRLVAMAMGGYRALRGPRHL